jgi:metal-sulfur cluster biosynthetic enzyme
MKSFSDSSSGRADAPVTITREQVMQALGQVSDPELGMSIVDLGLVYAVEIDGRRVAVTMTLTAPGCPIHDAMADWVREAVRKISGVEDVRVSITFDPPWTPDRITVERGVE